MSDQEYTELTGKISSNVAKLRQAIPDVMQGFSAMANSAINDNVLDKKTKELVALGIAVSTRCKGCIGFHTRTLVELGTTEAEFMETLGMAVYMGGGPSLMYAAEAVEAFHEFSQ